MLTHALAPSVFAILYAIARHAYGADAAGEPTISAVIDSVAVLDVETGAGVTPTEMATTLASTRNAKRQKNTTAKDTRNGVMHTRERALIMHTSVRDKL